MRMQKAVSMFLHVTSLQMLHAHIAASAANFDHPARSEKEAASEQPSVNQACVDLIPSIVSAALHLEVKSVHQKQIPLRCSIWFIEKALCLEDGTLRMWIKTVT